MRNPARSLRFRLTFWYCLALGLGMIVFSAFLLGLAEKHLMTNHDDYLKQRGTLAMDLLRQKPPAGVMEPWMAMQLAQFGKLALTQNIRGTEVLIYQSPELTRASIMNQISALPLEETPSEGLRTIVEKGKYWRCFNGRSHVPGTPMFTLWILEDLGDVQFTLKRLRLAFFHLVPLGLLVSFLGAYWLSTRALSPVVEIIALTRDIEANNLHQRLPHPGVDDEIGSLVDTLNHMIARLQDSFDSMKRFTADASHELRTPLATIRNMIDVSLATPKPPEETLETLQSVGEEVDRIRSLVEDLLLLARADSGRLVMDLHPIGLDQIAEMVVEGHQPQAGDRGITLGMGARVADPILGDERWLHQVFSNLLDNAIKFTPPGGCVEVDMARGEGTVSLSVRDSGPGIPEGDLERIFERLFRSDPSRSQSHIPGLGLGLAIASWVVKDHKGTIKAANRPEGGAELTVTLPLAPVLA